MKKISTIFLCGPIAKEGHPAVGGYQSNNLRILDSLQSQNIDIRALPYPQPQSDGIKKLVIYCWGFVALAIKVVTLQKRSIFHLTALRRSFLVPELILIFLAKIRRCRTILDIRDGLARDTELVERSSFYRHIFVQALKCVDLVMVEGEAQEPFVQMLCGKTPLLLPNQIDLRTVPIRNQNQVQGTSPKIAYAGAIKPEKGIRVILEAARIMQIDGLSPKVFIAGSGSEDFVSNLKQDFDDVDVEWLGPLVASEVLGLFSDSDFFVFPTQWPGEGQSNALTEAMACGCVPIVSDHGFNAATVDNGGVVLNAQATSLDYAREIQQIWRSNKRKMLSLRAKEQIDVKFSSQIVNKKLLDAYRNLGLGL